MPALPVMEDDQKSKVEKLSAVHISLAERWRAWRIMAIKCYEYIIGNQIDAEVRKALDEEHRPAKVFNLLLGAILYIGGTLTQNKTVLKAVPKRAGDEDATELHNVLVGDWWMPNCNGYDEIAKAGIDAAICGIGAINNRMDFSEDIEGVGITEAADPLTILLDPDAPLNNPEKRRYYEVTGFYTSDEIISIYSRYLKPETVALIKERAKTLEAAYKDVGKAQGWLTRVWNGAMDWLGIKATLEGNPYKTDFIDAANGMYRVIEFHDRRVVHSKVFYDPESRQTFDLPEAVTKTTETGSTNIEQPSGEANAIDEAPVANLLAQYPRGQVVDNVTRKEYWRMAAAPGLLPENLLFEAPYEVQNKGWQHQIVVAHDLHPDATKVLSLIMPGMDAQDSYNQRRMTALEAIMDMVNPPIEAHKGAIEDEEPWLSKVRGRLMIFKGEKPPEKRYPPSDLVTLLSGYAEEDRDLVQKILNITANMEGRKESANEPATLFNARVMQGKIMQALFMNHMIKAMRLTYSYVDGLIQTYLTSERAVRILAEPSDEMQSMPGVIVGKKEIGAYWMQVNYRTLDGVLNDVRQGEYDFTPDTMQLDQTMRMIKFEEMMQFVKMVPAEFVNWPETFRLWDNPIAPKMQAFAEQVMKAKMGELQTQSAIKQSVGQNQLMMNGIQKNAILEQVQKRVGA